MRRILCCLVLLLPLAACRAGAPAAPANTCYGNEPADSAIRAAFSDTPVLDHMEYIAHRESGCDPNALNPSSWAKGLFQLLGHDDLIHAACPLAYPAWNIAGCNAQAARYLYDSSGLAPWGG